jgi:type VI secretion system protein ImpA
MTVAELMLELLPDAQSRGLYSQLTGVMLDGSDTKSYVAPPAATPPVASSEPAAESAAAPAAEPEVQASPGGW